mmetsp:Transcript_12632/g.34041  ORF Transcript_12632/g.34041 Transcript_12632/m.34041 type:complete len:234 (-) Transcript_12632:389-1090(-)
MTCLASRQLTTSQQWGRYLACAMSSKAASKCRSASLASSACRALSRITSMKRLRAKVSSAASSMGAAMVPKETMIPRGRTTWEALARMSPPQPSMTPSAPPPVSGVPSPSHRPTSKLGQSSSRMSTIEIVPKTPYAAVTQAPRSEPRTKPMTRIPLIAAIWISDMPTAPQAGATTTVSPALKCLKQAIATNVEVSPAAATWGAKFVGRRAMHADDWSRVTSVCQLPHSSPKRR